MMVVLCSASLVGCGDPVGTPCLISGSGFTASDDCAHRCLSRWQLVCPNGASITPGQCAGSFGCAPGSCPQGQACYHDNDPFDDRSFCVRADVCGALTSAQQHDWELATQQRQDEVRRAREEKEARKAKWQAANPD